MQKETVNSNDFANGTCIMNPQHYNAKHSVKDERESPEKNLKIASKEPQSHSAHIERHNKSHISLGLTTSHYTKPDVKTTPPSLVQPCPKSQSFSEENQLLLSRGCVFVRC